MVFLKVSQLMMEEGLCVEGHGVCIVWPLRDVCEHVVRGGNDILGGMGGL